MYIYTYMCVYIYIYICVYIYIYISIGRTKRLGVISRLTVYTFPKCPSTVIDQLQTTVPNKKAYAYIR